jgi:hypothetical protein
VAMEYAKVSVPGCSSQERGPGFIRGGLGGVGGEFGRPRRGFLFPLGLDEDGRCGKVWGRGRGVEGTLANLLCVCLTKPPPRLCLDPACRPLPPASPRALRSLSRSSSRARSCRAC